MSFKEFDEYFETTAIDKSKHTLRSYTTILNSFISYFNINSIDDIKKLNDSDLQNYLNVVATNPNAKNKDTAKASANSHIRVIKAFLNWLKKHSYIKENPIDTIEKYKEAQTVKEFFNKEERDSIIFACRNKLWLQVTMALLFYTGLRREEAINLKISDYHGDYILVHRKGNKEQKLYFPKFVTQLVDKYLAKRKDNSEYLLVSIRGQHQFTTVSLGERVKEACRLAGIDEERMKDIGAHTIRRSFACILFLDGKSTLAIQACLNHSSPIVTERYVAPAKALMTGQIMSEQDSPSWWNED